MAFPFEVAVPPAELHLALLALSAAPAARGVYKQVDLRRHVVSFLQWQTFEYLADAVAAALCAGGVVRVLRDAIIPYPLRGKRLLYGTLTWCLIPPGASVTIVPKGGPCTLRHSGGVSDSLFAVSSGAVLTISGLRFEAFTHSPGARGRPDSGLYFATLQTNREQDARVNIADDVAFVGYAEVVHRATARERGLFTRWFWDPAAKRWYGRAV